MTAAPKPPALPEPAGNIPCGGRRSRPAFTTTQMLAAMAQAAREQRERDAALCDAVALNTEPDGFALDAANDCAAAIRAQEGKSND